MYNFWSIIIVQAVIFGAVTYAQRLPYQTALRQLGYGVAVGLPFGLCFDLLVGRTLHVFIYHAGYRWSFLVLNDAFSYGLFIATVLVLGRVSWFRLYSAVVLIAAVYEIANSYRPVWQWTWSRAGIWSEVVAIFILYPAFAVLVIYCMQYVRPVIAKNSHQN